MENSGNVVSMELEDADCVIDLTVAFLTMYRPVTIQIVGRMAFLCRYSNLRNTERRTASQNLALSALLLFGEIATK